MAYRHYHYQSERVRDYLEDGESLKKRALPVDDVAYDPSETTPLSASHYLRLVRSEAASCPQIVVAAVTSIPAPTVPPPETMNVRDIFRTGFAEGDDVPSIYLPSESWEKAFLAKFARIRLDEYEKPFERPPSGERAWRTFCYAEMKPPGSQIGQTPIEEANVSSPSHDALQTSESNPVEDGELDADAEEGEVDEKTEEREEEEHGILGLGDSVSGSLVEGSKDSLQWPRTPSSKKRKLDTLEGRPSLDEPDSNPLLGIVAQLDQGQAISLLKYHLKWLSTDDISNSQLRWLFALFSRVDPLLTGDEVSVVRDVCRKCRRIRASLARRKVGADDVRIAGLNMIISVVGGPFQQRDLRTVIES
ncbi:gem (nuclear organelle) associated protein 2 [Rhizophlyctis rosea]|uniref:Gem (Nuclear organelle) associated protein 2 n=1 Tax=Rhizophlyctis rosea TaxID=64517 RepID=A0AAD5X3D2_9FUNG|nr:gem (nuclear organelle) associated protein 2 [Rhizophlyctis rosea]